MNLEGEELHGFVRAELALAREERALIREENMEEDARIAAEAEMIVAKDEAVRIAAMEEAERIRQHETEVLRIQVEADRIRFHETSMSRKINDSAKYPGTVGVASSYLILRCYG